MTDKKKFNGAQDAATGGHLTERLGGKGGKTASLTGGHLSPKLGPKNTGSGPGAKPSETQGPPRTKP